MSLVSDLIGKQVSVLTCDSRHIIGVLRGYDQHTNLIMESCSERVYTDAGVESVPMGLYIVRGDNLIVIGEIEIELENQIDFTKSVSNLSKSTHKSLRSNEGGRDDGLSCFKSSIQIRGYLGAEKFSKSHQWVKVDNEIGIVGVTSHALKDIGDVLFVDLPRVDQKVTKDQVLASIEAGKTTLDLQTPVSGVVLEVNQELADNPTLLRNSSDNVGWLYKIKLDSPDEFQSLLDAKAYHEYCGESQ